MSAQPYSDRVRELFFRPRHAGCIDGAARTEVDDQGVRLCLCARLEDGRIGRMGFRAWGCPHVIAAAEALCAWAEGKPPSALLEFSANDLMQSLPVPVEKVGRILVLEDAARKLAAVIQKAGDEG